MAKPERPSPPLPLYRQVKEYIESRIAGGTLCPGEKIESETELVSRLKVSRMTVNRALRELATEQRIIRIQGRGSFVAEKKPQSALVEIRSIAREIRERGGVYSCHVHLLQAEKAQPAIAATLGLPPYSEVFHSIIVHMDHDIPIQLGCRYVNPAIAPRFLEQDFTKTTVSDYLLQLAPVSRVEHVVEALIPEPWMRDLLKINSSEPCLALHRKTWVDDTIATYSSFYYPGSRYSLGSTFMPTSPGASGLS